MIYKKSEFPRRGENPAFFQEKIKIMCKKEMFFCLYGCYWMGGAIYCTPPKACRWTNSKRPGIEQRTPDEQNEASFSSPSMPRSKRGMQHFLENLLIAIKTPHFPIARRLRRVDEQIPNAPASCKKSLRLFLLGILRPPDRVHRWVLSEEAQNSSFCWKKRDLRCGQSKVCYTF